MTVDAISVGLEGQSSVSGLSAAARGVHTAHVQCRDSQDLKGTALSGSQKGSQTQTKSTRMR